MWPGLSVLDRIRGLKSNHGCLNTTHGGPLSDVVVDGAQNVWVNVVAHARVDQDVIAFTEGIKRVFRRRALFRKLTSEPNLIRCTVAPSTSSI